MLAIFHEVFSLVLNGYTLSYIFFGPKKTPVIMINFCHQMKGLINNSLTSKYSDVI